MDTATDGIPGVATVLITTTGIVLSTIQDTSTMVIPIVITITGTIIGTTVTMVGTTNS